MLDEGDEGCLARPSQPEFGCSGTPFSGLHLILEESGSLVPESPLSNLSGTRRKDLGVDFLAIRESKLEVVTESV